LQSIPVGLDRLRDAPGQPVGQPVVDGLRDRVTVTGPHTSVELGVQLLKPVPDLSLGRPADLLADPLPARVETERDHAADQPYTKAYGLAPAMAPKQNSGDPKVTADLLS